MQIKRPRWLLQGLTWRPRRRGQTAFAAFGLGLDPSAAVLVLAPHCDDETLGAGGLIYQALQQGLRVRVVLLTNGDGSNRYAVRGHYRRLRVNPAQYIELAYLRQAETLAALRAVGLAPEHVFFLGYPDRGLAALWDGHWDGEDPYRSRFTRVTRSPYRNSFTPGAPFLGRSVVADLKRIIEAFEPTHIVTCHPQDAHADHWATYCFTLYALEELWEAHPGRFQDVVILGYLIHRGIWPQPRGFRPRAPLYPPRALAHLPAPWLTLDLPGEAVQAKHDAVLQYRSQLTFMGRYLLSFVRRNELFGVPRPLAVPQVPEGQIVVDGEADDWSGIQCEVLDPVRDHIARSVGRSADIRCVATCCDESNLYLRMELRHRAVNDFLYCFLLHGVTRENGGPPGRSRLEVALRVPDRATVRGEGRWHPTGEVICRARRHQLEVAVPLDLLGRPHRIFLGVETRYRGLVVDRLAWQSLVLPESVTGAARPARETHPARRPRGERA